MSKYEVRIENTATKALSKIHPQYQTKIADAISALGTNPRPDGCTKLSGTKDAYRVRVSDYRVVYTVDDGIKVVAITRIGHRRDVYER